MISRLVVIFSLFIPGEKKKKNRSVQSVRFQKSCIIVRAQPHVTRKYKIFIILIAIF